MQLKTWKLQIKEGCPRGGLRPSSPGIEPGTAFVPLSTKHACTIRRPCISPARSASPRRTQHDNPPENQLQDNLPGSPMPRPKGAEHRKISWSHLYDEWGDRLEDKC